MSEPESGSHLRSGGAVARTGAGLILVAGQIHLVLTPAHLEEATCLGLLFLANFVGTAAVSGYYIAALLDVSISGMMAAMTGALFLTALFFSPSHGLAANFARRRKNSRIFSRDLLLSRVGTLGEKTTEEELAHSLGWEKEKISRSLDEALREGFIVRPSNGEVAVTRKGRDAAERASEVSV